MHPHSMGSPASAVDVGAISIRALETQQFTAAFAVTIGVALFASALAVLQSATIGFDHWPIAIGQATCFTILILIRIRLHRI